MVERKHAGHNQSDPLRDAHAIQAEAALKGFDWPDISGVFEKVQEEIGEIQEALEEGNLAHAKKELGDLLFAVVNLSRFLDAVPWEELHGANERFNERFVLLKADFDAQGRRMESCSLAELDLVWERVKGLLAERSKKGLT